MAQAYSAAFARVYDLRWAGFATQVAPRLRAFYEQQPAREAPRALLDVGCGTGHLAYHFLESGYEVAGLDLSPAMLAHARQRCAAYIAGGQAVFFEADAASFQLPRQFGLVVSTFDALNHLPDMAALQGAFASVRRALAPGGLFVFDLNTALGLAQRWNSISIDDTEELFLLNRGIYQPDAGQAYPASLVSCAATMAATSASRSWSTTPHSPSSR